MRVWGSSKEVSLHLPATATSTLHTDTIDYVRGSDMLQLRRDPDNGLYDNLPGNRRGLHNALSAYKLDANTEPDPNIRRASAAAPHRNSFKF